MKKVLRRCNLTKCTCGLFNHSKDNKQQLLICKTASHLFPTRHDCSIILLSFFTCIVGCRGASQLGGSLLGIPPGYKANKLKESLSYPLGLNGS